MGYSSWGRKESDTTSRLNNGEQVEGHSTKGLKVEVLTATGQEARLNPEPASPLSTQIITPTSHCWCLLLAQQKSGLG